MASKLRSCRRADTGAARHTLIAASVFAVLYGGSAFAATNLVQDPGFTLGSAYWRQPATAVIKAFTNKDGSRFNASCVPLTTEQKVDASKPGNLIYLPNMASLATDQRYRLSFEVFRDTLSSTAKTGRIMASVTATERVLQTGYFPLVYGEQQLPVAVSSTTGAERQTLSFDFTTPVSTTKFPISTEPTELMFQALADNNSASAANLCVTNVQLTPLGTNFQTMLPTTPVIRYNQVVVTQEDGSLSYFTILNPPIPSTLELVNDSGTYVEASITATQTDVHSKLPYFSYTYVNDPRNTPFKLRLKNAQGTVVAETPVITPKLSNPYTVAAPNLKRDALHFFYAQRAGQAITDNRYPEYRNWFNRAAGHVKKTKEGVIIPETATCFSGIDNFGNDFAGTCKVVATGDTNPSFNVSGGWYDAGDQGKYVVNAATALWQMQNIIETKQAKGTLNQDFPPNMLGNGNTGRSDLLEEAKYEMEWLLKMQIKTPLTVRVPTGNQDKSPPAGYGPLRDTPEVTNWRWLGRTYQAERYLMRLKLEPVDAQGMVFSAVRDEKWTPIPTAPASDSQARVLDYPTTTATMNFAAVAAQCYRIWKNDAREGVGQANGLANRCLAAAKTAWTAVVKDDGSGYSKSIYRYGEYSEGATTVLRAINEGGGAYADVTEHSEKDALYWAGLELYLATVDSATGTAGSESLKYLKAGVRGKDFRILTTPYSESFTWKSNKNMAILSLLAANRNSKVIADAIAADSAWTGDRTTPLAGLGVEASNLLAKINRSPFGVPHIDALHPDSQPFNWASNADIGNAGVLLAAYSVYGGTGSTYTMAARRVLSYLFGNNPMGKSYVTGYGTNPVLNPHHRFWAKHADIRYPSVPPGMLVGGPNGKWIGTLIGNAYYESGAWKITEPGSLYYMTKIVPKCNPYDTSSTGIYSDSPNQGGIACYQDDYRLFMTNEVAINWNAPLLWLSAFLK